MLTTRPGSKLRTIKTAIVVEMTPSPKIASDTPNKPETVTPISPVVNRKMFILSVLQSITSEDQRVRRVEWFPQPILVGHNSIFPRRVARPIERRCLSALAARQRQRVEVPP